MRLEKRYYYCLLFLALCLVFSLRTVYYSQWGPGYIEPYVGSTRIPIEQAPHGLALSLFDYKISPSVSFTRTRLLILVISAPNENARRRRIRRTWGLRRDLEAVHAALVFVVGFSSDWRVKQNFELECAEFDDLLHDSNLVENYYNLTRKVLSALYWASIQPWHQLRFIVKVDSDTHMTLSQLIWAKSLVKPELPEIVGKVYTKTFPYRHPAHKWFLSESAYPHSTFPKYASGLAYMMTFPAALRLVCRESLEDIKASRILPYEDVFITGILRQRLGIELKHNRWMVSSWF